MNWTIAAAALLTAHAAPPTPPPACIDRAQIVEATLFVLPSALEALETRCRAALPANAYLLNGGHELSQRLAAASPQHWAGARGVITWLGKSKMPDEIGPDTARSLIRDLLASELKKISSADCLRINEGAEILAPLPPENLGRLVALFLDLAATDKKKGGQPPICR